MKRHAHGLKGDAIETLIAWTGETLRAQGKPDTSRQEFESWFSAILLGEELRKMRIEADLTQGQVAAEMGYSQARISQMENGSEDGERGLTLSQALRYARACGYELEFRAFRTSRLKGSTISDTDPSRKYKVGSRFGAASAVKSKRTWRSSKEASTLPMPVSRKAGSTGHG
jgi:transcriptional regulator with XRE-family HTH domain